MKTYLITRPKSRYARRVTRDAARARGARAREKFGRAYARRAAHTRVWHASTEMSNFEYFLKEETLDTAIVTAVIS